MMNAADYHGAIGAFQSIPMWKDAEDQIEICGKKLEERRKAAEENRRLAEKAKKKRIRIVSIIAAAIVLCVAAFFIVTGVVIPNINYNNAMDLYNAGQYGAASAQFKALGDFKDSKEMVTACEEAIETAAER